MTGPLQTDTISTANGSVSHSVAAIWTSNNDGAGSGLDADLLDGVQLQTNSIENGDRVLRTGAFGIGCNNARPAVNIGNADDYSKLSGVYEYNYDIGDTGGAGPYGHLFVIGLNTPDSDFSWPVQLFFGTDGDMFVRHGKDQSSWEAWQKLAFASEVDAVNDRVKQLEIALQNAGIDIGE
jgi:hypothetical protein